MPPQQVGDRNPDSASFRIVTIWLSLNFDFFMENLRPARMAKLESSRSKRSRIPGAGQGSVGDSYDNALAETVNGLYKAEVIHRRGPWRSFEAVEFATLEWVDWFNNRRLLEPIGYIPPAEAEQRYYDMLDQPAIAA